MKQTKKLMVLFSIVQPDTGKKLIKELKNRGINIHFQFVGYGTAPTEMMDIFGLCNNTKDIVVSLGPEKKINDLMSSISTGFNSQAKYGGLIISLKLSAANRIISEILHHGVEENDNQGEMNMKNEHLNNLIFISVNNGFADNVMTTAKQYGATGGTIIKGRLQDSEQLIELGQLYAGEEREIICILAPETVSHDIMEHVNEEFGVYSEANGIVCSVPTEKAFKI